MASGLTPTTATDEDITIGYVLVDVHAPTAEKAAVALVAAARDEWVMEFEEPVVPEDGKRRWFRPAEDGDGFDEEEHALVSCAPTDPRRDSEWWCFDLPEWKARIARADA